MSPALLYGISLFFVDTPWYFMACVPFWKDRRIKKSIVLSTILIAAILRSVTGYIGMTYAADNWGAILILTYLLYSAVLIAFFRLCFRVSLVKILCAQLLLQALATAVNYIAKAFLNILFPGQEILASTTPLYFVSIIILIAVTFPFIFRFFKNVMREAFYELSDKNTFFLCIVLIFFFITHTVFNLLLNDTSIPNVTQAIMLLLVVAMGLVSYYINIKMYLEAVHHTRMEKNLFKQNELLDNMNAMKNEFFANASHEMKTPLTVISAAVQFADALLEAEGGNPEIQEAMKNAQSEAMRIARLVSSTLNLASMRESKQRMRQIDFGELVRHCGEAYRLLIGKNNNALVIDTQNNLTKIFANADMLAQAVTNLIDNANRNTQNGKLTLTVQDTERGVSLVVADTGIGVSPELLPLVFDRSVSGTGSTGYGLYLCKNIAGIHRGDITIESEPDKGTSVTLTLPAYEGQEDEITIHNS